MDWVRAWLEDSPYVAALGARLLALDESSARLALPYADANSNGDRALHGGVAASLVALGGQAVARAALGRDTGPWHTSAVQVAYLGAALGEDVEAGARLLRRGKELAYTDVEVRSASGKPVARGLACVRGRLAAEPAALPLAAGDAGESDRGPMGPHIGRVPFHQKLGLFAEHMAGARSRIALPWKTPNADAAGGVSEGALLALLDTTGAMAAWAATGPGRFKASTSGIQARVLAPPGAADLIGYGSIAHRDGEALFAEVEIALASDRALIARGTVNYRIVIP